MVMPISGVFEGKSYTNIFEFLRLLLKNIMDIR